MSEPRVPSRNKVDWPAVDHYLELSKRAFERFHTRRVYEWRVSLSLWTALGLASWFMTQVGDLSVVVRVGLILIAVAVNVIYILKWTPGLARSSENDRRTAYFWESAAIQEMGGYDLPKQLQQPDWHRVQSTDPPCKEFRCKWFNWAFGTHIMVTIFFALLFVFTVIFIPPLPAQQITPATTQPASATTTTTTTTTTTVPQAPS